MGIKTTTTTSYECDLCASEIKEEQVFTRAETSIWRDRDVEARIAVSMALTIDYVTDKGVVCKRCAAIRLREIADAADKEYWQ